MQQSYFFPEGCEPYNWGIEKICAAWRGYKAELKMACFNNQTHNQAIEKRPKHIPEDMWKNLVEFWESPKGQVIPFPPFMCLDHITS